MIISIKNASCGYKGKRLIKELNMTLNTGAGVCILGPNGIGKTTLFKSLLGQIGLLSGNIIVDGKNLNDLSGKQRAKIFSYVPQAKDSTYQHTVKDIVLMGRAPYIKQFSMPSDTDVEIVETQKTHSFSK